MMLYPRAELRTRSSLETILQYMHREQRTKWSSPSSVLCSNLNRSSNNSLYSTSNGCGTLHNLNSDISQSLGLAEIKSSIGGRSCELLFDTHGNILNIPFRTNAPREARGLTIFRQEHGGKIGFPSIHAHFSSNARVEKNRCCL